MLCVDIGGTSTKAGALDAAGELHFIESVPTRPDPETYLGKLCELITHVQNAATGNGYGLNGIGVAVAGFLNPERDRLLYNSNLAWLEGFPLRDGLARNFDLPIQMEVDSNAACMAEYRFGSGRGSRRFLCVTAGTGLGVGMTIDGVPYASRTDASAISGISSSIAMGRSAPVADTAARRSWSPLRRLHSDMRHNRAHPGPFRCER